MPNSPSHIVPSSYKQATAVAMIIAVGDDCMITTCCERNATI